MGYYQNSAGRNARDREDVKEIESQAASTSPISLKWEILRLQYFIPVFFNQLTLPLPFTHTFPTLTPQFLQMYHNQWVSSQMQALFQFVINAITEVTTVRLCHIICQRLFKVCRDTQKRNVFISVLFNSQKIYSITDCRRMTVIIIGLTLTSITVFLQF